MIESQPYSLFGGAERNGDAVPTGWAAHRRLPHPRVRQSRVCPLKHRRVSGAPHPLRAHAATPELAAADRAAIQDYRPRAAAAMERTGRRLPHDRAIAGRWNARAVRPAAACGALPVPGARTRRAAAPGARRFCARPTRFQRRAIARSPRRARSALRAAWDDGLMRYGWKASAKRVRRSRRLRRDARSKMRPGWSLSRPARCGFVRFTAKGRNTSL